MHDPDFCCGGFPKATGNFFKSTLWVPMGRGSEFNSGIMLTCFWGVMHVPPRPHSAWKAPDGQTSFKFRANHTRLESSPNIWFCLALSVLAWANERVHVSGTKLCIGEGSDKSSLFQNSASREPTQQTWMGQMSVWKRSCREGPATKTCAAIRAPQENEAGATTAYDLTP